MQTDPTGGDDGHSLALNAQGPVLDRPESREGGTAEDSRFGQWHCIGQLEHGQGWNHRVLGHARHGKHVQHFTIDPPQPRRAVVEGAVRTVDTEEDGAHVIPVAAAFVAAPARHHEGGHHAGADRRCARRYVGTVSDDRAGGLVTKHARLWEWNVPAYYMQVA